MTQYKKDIIKYAKNSALFSFLIGTLIFFAFLLFRIEFIALFAILFVLLASVINGLILLQLFYLWFIKVNDRNELRKVILIVLINIPIALVFLKIGGSLYRNKFGV